MLNFPLSLNINNFEKLIANFEIRDFQHLPVHIYWKNRKGIYLGSNDIQAKNAGFEHGSDLNGKTDHDLMLSNEVNRIQRNDELIIKEQNPRTFIESATLASCKIKTLTYKLPLRSVQKKKIAGIFGISFLMKDHDTFFNENEHSDKISFLPTSIDLAHLTQRQKECLFWLARGYTMKKIGKQLGISARTVEYHLEIIKNKLNVATRQELIEKIATQIIKI